MSEMHVEPVSNADRLRIAVLGDFDGIHTRSWIRWFVARGHDVHAISFYPPTAPLDGVTLHVLKLRAQVTAGASSDSSAATGAPRSLLRIIHAARYRRAGLRRVLSEIRPDVLHGHFLVEHGFYGATAGFHPYVISAWGSDVLVEPKRDPVSRQLARWTIGRADLVTSNNQRMADEIVALGAPRSKVEIVTLGADAWFGERWSQSPNVSASPPASLVVLSTRAHEPLYNIESIIDAFALAREKLADARLVIAHSGALTPALQEHASPVDNAVSFEGTVGPERLRDLMTEAAVFVSVPSSDGTSVALLQAMSAGAFPIVSDLETIREWITDGENGLLVPLGAPVALAEAIVKAASDAGLRRRAATRNREIARERGTNETQMAKMERLYLALARKR